MKWIKKCVNEDIKFDKLTYLAIFSLVISISGVFGFVYEYIFYFINSGFKTFYYRGGNFLPWINIYAIGAIMIYILTYKYRKKPLKVFLISMISTGILEYLAGYLMYHFNGGIRCWNYDTEILGFLSIDGYVCLRSVLFFGLSGLILTYLIIPLCFYLAKNTNKTLFLTFSFTLGFIFLADEFYNLIFTKIFDLPRASTIYKKIGIPYMNYYQ